MMRRVSPRRLVLACVLAGAIATTSAAGAQAALVADYRFDGTLTSSVGTAPELVPVAKPGDTPEAPAYVDQNGDMAYSFLDDRGLSLSTAGLLPQDQYAVVMTFRFAEVGGYKRILRFSDEAGDNGTYLYEGAPGYYNNNNPDTSWNGGSALIAADTDVQVAFVRTADGKHRVYADGVLQVERDDVSSTSRLSTDVLRFFLDDGGEMSPGTVARIRLYDAPLSAEDVAAIHAGQDAAPPPPPPPTTTTTTTPPPPVVLPPAPLPSGSIAWLKPVVRKGRLTPGARFTCPAGGASCKATLVLRSVPKKGAKAKVLLRASTTLKPGTSATPTLRATKAVRKVRIAVEASITGPDGKRVTRKRTVRTP